MLTIEPFFVTDCSLVANRLERFCGRSGIFVRSFLKKSDITLSSPQYHARRLCFDNVYWVVATMSLKNASKSIQFVL